jgi:putative hydrolase of the HAD superfamily
MRLKGVAFDLFHTLTGFESQWATLPVTSAVLGIDQRFWNDALLSKSRWRLTGEERDPVTIIRTLAHSIDPSIPEDLIRAATSSRIQRFRQALMTIPAANLDTLRQLRNAGYRLGLVSNADVMEMDAWQDCPAAGLFDVEVFSCQVGLVKPEPEIYERCLRQLELEPGECLFVGDGGSGELQGAKSIGMQTAFVFGVIEELWPDKIASRRKIADYSLRFVPELLTMLLVS